MRAFRSRIIPTRRSARQLAALLAASLAGASGASGQASERPPALLTGLGDHHHAITTRDSAAQRYFDQGLRLNYAFNHAEAARAFREAARRDPTCAMCVWGQALVLGPNINAPMDTAVAREAYALVRRARELSVGASDRERAYIDALARRYAAGPVKDRSALDRAYANAMRGVARRYPGDLDAATLFAEALMDTSPWDYWTAGGAPRPAMRELVPTLERVMARDSTHPGACHYYIHAVEAAYPERAVPCAERLAALMPAAGHVVHMPAHIYIRVGRYADAIEANKHAVHADEVYIADQRPRGLYPVAYYPHNYHFLAFASTLAGRSAEAIEAARSVVAKTPVEAARAAPDLEPLLSYHHLTLATFGRWDELLREPLPPSDLRVATGLAHYARGLALAATGQWPEAGAALDTVKQVGALVTAGSADVVLDIARHALAGQIAGRRGQWGAAVQELRTAMRLEDGLGYMEPPYWHFPTRHALGTALLKAGRPAEAERRYREDLKRFPENGWALRGLERSLTAQGKTREADEVAQRRATAWQQADGELAAAEP